MTPPSIRVGDFAISASPVLGTDASHDAINQAMSHDAELDREARQGMVTVPDCCGLCPGVCIDPQPVVPVLVDPLGSLRRLG